MGWFSGKDKTYKADPFAADINAAAKEGMDGARSGFKALSGVYDQDPSQVVNSQIGIENKMLRGASQDAMMRTRELLAQRGMGSSSIGLGQQVNQERSLAEKLGLNQASGFSRLRDMQIENAQGKMNAGNQLMTPKLSQGVQMTDIKQKSGGLAGLVNMGAQAAAAYYGSGGGQQKGGGQSTTRQSYGYDDRQN
jgi:hypothetical protein